MKLNKRERKAQQLLAHYATCERLAKYLGANKPDGKKISVALFKAEQIAHRAATAYCNGTGFFLPDCPKRGEGQEYNFGRNEEDWDTFAEIMRDRVSRIFGRSHMHPLLGFFVNGDARGFALKIDNDKPEGKALIEAVKLHTDWGGYGILSPEITGN